jgi:glycosyltransferase involved in cell wall biosynthesis
MGYARDTWRLSRLLRPYRDQVDLIHVNRVGCEIQSIAAKLAGFKRVVTTIHNLPGEAEKNNWVCRWVERLSFACGDVHIAVSEATYEEWHERVGLEKKETIDHRPETIDRRDKGANASRSKVYGLWSMVFSHQPRGKGVVIYNGMDPVDLTGFDRRAYRQQFCNNPDHTFIIGICARLHRMKGHVVLLEAFARLLKGMSSESSPSPLRGEGWGEGDCRRSENNTPHLNPLPQGERKDMKKALLLIAGDGPERLNIEAKIAALGIGDYVQLLGHRNDAERFVACLDLNVLPSVALETVGYSVIEAMFHGTPSVVSDVGGAKEMIRASGGGAVAPAGDVRAWAGAMAGYMVAHELRVVTANAGRAYAVHELTAKKMADQTLIVYRHIVADTQIRSESGHKSI